MFLECLSRNSFGICLPFWDYWKEGPKTDGEMAKAAFTAYTTNWKNQQFAHMYEQLSLDTKAKVTKDEFVSRYENIYGGIEAKPILVEPLYNGDVVPTEDGKINFHYRIKLDTFVEPISFTGKATLIKETQNDKKIGTSIGIRLFYFPGCRKGIRCAPTRCIRSGEKYWTGPDAGWLRAGSWSMSGFVQMNGAKRLQPGGHKSASCCKYRWQT